MNKIPKKIHYCWFGHGEKNELIIKCIDSWKKQCPEYEIIEWNEENFDVNKNLYCKQAYDNKCWAFVSDYARLWILYNHGGIYLDTDVELIKRIDDLLKYNSFFCCESNNSVNTGLGVGATKNNKIIKAILDDYEKISFEDHGRLDKIPCPIRNTKTINSYLNMELDVKDILIIDNNAFLPKEYFCPLDYDSKKLNITNKTYGIHWYNESWLSNKQKIRKKILVKLRNTIGEEKYNKIKNKFKKKR